MVLSTRTDSEIIDILYSNELVSAIRRILMEKYRPISHTLDLIDNELLKAGLSTPNACSS